MKNESANIYGASHYIALHWIYETVQYVISVDLPTVSELYCTVLLYPLLQGIFIYCTELHCTALRCTALYCTEL